MKERFSVHLTIGLLIINFKNQVTRKRRYKVNRWNKTNWK